MAFTRRELLAGIGGGSLAVGGLALGRSAPRFAQYTYAAPDSDTDDGRLRVAWYERYNGTFAGSQSGTDAGLNDTLDPASTPAYVEDATLVTGVSGPVVALDDVMPGDEGTLVVGLEVVDFDGAEPLDVWFRAAVTADEENRLNGPEAAAGDTSTDAGELDDRTFVEVWLDGSPLGSCDGRKDFAESLESPLVARTTFDAAFGPGSDSVYATDAGSPAFDACLTPGDLRCVALAWEFPEAADNNVAQTDSFTFEFEFGAVPCGSEASPFEVTQ